MVEVEGTGNRSQYMHACEQLVNFRSEQQVSREEKTYESGFPFPEDVDQAQEWLEPGYGMKNTSSHNSVTRRNDLLDLTVCHVQLPQNLQ